MPTKCPELFINGITLERETVTNFLGIFIDENGKPIAKLTQFPPRFPKKTGILYRARLIIPRKTNNSQLNHF